MPIITLMEILEIIVTSLVLGYLFSGFITAPHKNPIKFYTNKLNRYFNWEDIKYSMLVTGPAIILHEFGHKIVALSLGFPSVFHGILTGGSIVLIGAGIGLVLRLIGAPLMFLIPGYVAPAFAGAWDGISASQMSMIAFAGPLVNLVLFVIFWALLRSEKYPKYFRFFYICKTINLWLFILNMLPIGPLDGAKVFKGLFVILGFNS